jgi:hypothetical protein
LGEFLHKKRACGLFFYGFGKWVSVGLVLRACSSQWFMMKMGFQSGFSVLNIEFIAKYTNVALVLGCVLGW